VLGLVGGSGMSDIRPKTGTLNVDNRINEIKLITKIFLKELTLVDKRPISTLLQSSVIGFRILV